MRGDTDLLIEQLAARARPVRPLAPPLLRTLAWCGAVVAVALLVVVLMGWRGAPPEDFAHPGGRWSWWGSVVAGLLAAYAVFQVSVPGRSPAWAWLPVPAVIAWFAGMGWGCLAQVRADGGVVALGLDSWHCALAITLASAPMLLVMLLLVRHAGVVRPVPTAVLAMLSAAGLSSAAVSLVHGHETALLTLAWHGGVVLLLCAAAWLSGRPLLGWIGYARR